MKIRHILLGLGTAGVLFTATVGGVGWWGLTALGHRMDDSVIDTQATQNVTLGDMMHDALRGDVFQALMYAQSGQTDPIGQAQKEAHAHGQEFIERVQALQALPLPDAIESDIRTLAPTVKRYAEAGERITQLAAQDSKAALEALPAFLALFSQLEGEQAKVIDAIEANAKASAALAAQTRDHALWAIIGTTFAAALLLCGAALAVTHRLIATLGAEPLTVRKLLNRISAGDLGLTVRVQAGDTQSVIAGLSDMVAQLRGTVAHVRGNADSVSSASSQVAAGSTDLASRTQDQAAALDRSASALEQLSSTVGQNADSAAQASKLAQGASDVASQGGSLVTQLVGTMQDINQSSRKISDIIGVIDGIAFQTNILALNAAVEAARAGEQGRGFAVVAGEVRSLAQRSAEAAREIKSLITASVERVATGAQQADEAGSTMQDIVSAIARVNDIIGEISSASREQTAGIAQVTEAVNLMDQSTQSNASLVEQTAAAAQSLRHQADQLARSVSTFKLTAQG